MVTAGPKKPMPSSRTDWSNSRRSSRKVLTRYSVGVFFGCLGVLGAWVWGLMGHLFYDTHIKIVFAA